MKNLTMDASRKAASFLEEFRNFAFKGNVVDLAIGVIIGTAFGNIVNSLVQNIIMPVIGLIPAFGKGYEDWALTVGDKVVPYGRFLGDVLNFLIVAFALYIFIVKFLGWVLRTKKEAPPAPPTKQEQLLVEIRDILKARNA
jgi:large conductance mechanosensitive channel